MIKSIRKVLLVLSLSVGFIVHGRALDDWRYYKGQHGMMAVSVGGPQVLAIVRDEGFVFKTRFPVQVFSAEEVAEKIYGDVDLIRRWQIRPEQGISYIRVIHGRGGRKDYFVIYGMGNNNWICPAVFSREYALIPLGIAMMEPDSFLVEFVYEDVGVVASVFHSIGFTEAYKEVLGHDVFRLIKQ